MKRQVRWALESRVVPSHFDFLLGFFSSPEPAEWQHVETGAFRSKLRMLQKDLEDMAPRAGFFTRGTEYRVRRTELKPVKPGSDGMQQQPPAGAGGATFSTPSDVPAPKGASTA